MVAEVAGTTKLSSRRCGRLSAPGRPSRAEFVEAGKSAFAWHNIDAELAQLTYDSTRDSDQAPSMRTEAASIRALTFTSAHLTIELEVTSNSGLGQITRTDRDCRRSSLQDFRFGGYHIDRDDVVAGRPELPHQPAIAAAEAEPRDSALRVGAAGRGRSNTCVARSTSCQRAPAGARTIAAVDPRLPRASAEVDHQPVIAYGGTGTSMAPPRTAVRISCSRAKRTHAAISSTVVQYAIAIG